MLKTIESIHRKIYEADKPEVIARAPIICTLLGAFAEACQGYSMLCCSSKKVQVAISRRPDNNIRLYRIQGNEKKRFTLGSLRYRKEDRWANYVKGIIAVLTNEGYVFTGMNITIEGDVFGLYESALSSTLAVATILALDRLYDFKLQTATLLRVVFQANTVFNDEICRIGDLMAMLNGKEGQVMILDQQHFTYRYLPFCFDGQQTSATAFLINSKVSQAAIRSEYRLARKCACESISSLWKQYKDIPKRDIPEKDITSRVIALPEEYRHACVFVLRESRFVMEASEQLEQKDVVQYGRTMNKVQVDLRDRLEVTCPEVDWLTKRAGEVSGCYGASLVFDGNGGTIMIVIEEGMLPEYEEKIEEYGHIFGFSPVLERFVPQEGAKVVFP
ncbi:MAG: galactokinase [Spirochaetia bacterium]|jgi:galactokinase|nr:galactokinase [Spirochaetia bacterium]